MTNAINKSLFAISSEQLDLKTEGAGSLYQRYLFAFLYSVLCKKQYTYVEQKIYEGHYIEQEYEEIVTLWKKIFSFLHVNIKTKSLKASEVSFELAYQKISELAQNEREKLLEAARAAFNYSVKEANLLPAMKLDRYVIAIHLRGFGSGDIDWFENYTFPWQYFNKDYGLPDNNPGYYAKLYANIVNKVFAECKDKVKILHIHTTINQLDLEYFLGLIAGDVKVVIIADSAPIAFLDLVYADVLIASHSSFSWLASLLRTKVTYIRADFRYFTTLSTKIIPEILYENHSLSSCVRIWCQKNLAYLKFYPIYYWNMLCSGLYKK